MTFTKDTDKMYLRFEKKITKALKMPSRTLFPVREWGSPAESPRRFRQKFEILIGAAQVRFPFRFAKAREGER